MIKNYPLVVGSESLRPCLAKRAEMESRLIGELIVKLKRCLRYRSRNGWVGNRLF